MRGAATSLTAAASGFVIFLLAVSVIQGQDDSVWRVTYISTQICALKGSTVELRCTYTYPSRWKNSDTKVRKTFWFTKMKDDIYVDLTTDSEYSGRAQDHCENNNCTLTITNLRESDSGVYYFRFITDLPHGAFSGFRGVTLSVTDLQVQVSSNSEVYDPDDWPELECRSSCSPAGHPSFIWFKNGQKIHENALHIYPDVKPADRYSCALKGHENFPSPSVYAPKLPSVSVSPSGEIMEGSSVNLTCSSDANPAATYAWYKDNPDLHLFSKEPQLVFRSIKSSDSGEYYCAAENKLNRTSKCVSLNVKYAPKISSVSVSPSGEIVEGSSVTLSCSSDANPAAKYTWYKKNQTLLQGTEGSYHFTSISSEDRGIYYCKSENQYGRINSTFLFIDVQYAPKLPSVSVSPFAETVEGSSVNLTCSSDANPAANFTWYKKNEDSPKASGQIFSITDFRAEHSGSYYCVAENRRGCHNSTSHLTVAALMSTTTIMNIFKSTVVVLMLVSLLFLSLWMRKKNTLSSTTEPHEPIELDSSPVYENAAETEDTEEKEDLV